MLFEENASTFSYAFLLLVVLLVTLYEEINKSLLLISPYPIPLGFLPAFSTSFFFCSFNFYYFSSYSFFNASSFYSLVILKCNPPLLYYFNLIQMHYSNKCHSYSLSYCCYSLSTSLKHLYPPIKQPCNIPLHSSFSLISIMVIRTRL